MILISDSIRATGMPDGQYTLGGQDVKVVGKRATLGNTDTIAGSATNLMDCMRTAVKQMGLPLEVAVGCATINPARSWISTISMDLLKQERRHMCSIG